MEPIENLERVVREYNLPVVPKEIDMSSVCVDPREEDNSDRDQDDDSDREGGDRGADDADTESDHRDRKHVKNDGKDVKNDRKNKDKQVKDDKDKKQDKKEGKGDKKDKEVKEKNEKKKKDKYDEKNCSDDGESDDDDDECDDDDRDPIFSMQYDYFLVDTVSASDNNVVFSAVEKETKKNVIIKIGGKDDEWPPLEHRVMIHLKRNKVSGISEIDRMFRVGRHWVIVMPEYPTDSIRKTVWGHPEKIKIIMRSLLKSLYEMHDAGIIYRDVKLTNIAWDSENEEIKILDFDLATFERKQKHTIPCGTEGFEAPEILAEDVYDNKVDMYSAGVVMGCMLFKVSEDDVSREMVVKWIKKMKSTKKKNKAYDLCRSLLSFHASKRPTKDEALNHPYFAE